MHFSSILILLASSHSGLTLSIPSESLSSRQAGTGNTTSGSGGLPAILQAVTSLNDTLSKAETTLAPYKGGTIKGLVDLLNIASSVGGLGDQITALTQIAQATPQLSVDQSVQLGQSFLTVQPMIGGLLNTLVQKRPELDKAAFRVLDVRALIHDVMSEQSQNAGALTSSLVKILDPSLQPVAGPIVEDVNKNFSSTLNAFDGRAGLIKVPAALVPQLTQLLGGLTSALGGGDGGADGGGGGLLGAAGGGAKVIDATASPGEGMDVIMAASANPLADAAARSIMNSISDARLARLGPNENDVQGLPLPVVAVMRTFNIV